jgi:CDP-2,3-bis-(O-geranylgeranyl)-sn-glycerol synthase
LDFVVGALLAVAPLAELAWADVVAVLVVTFVGDIVVNRAAYRLGIKSTPW